MRLHVHAFAWNEAALAPYFLRHYASFAERVYVYDNQSDDGTPEILSRHPRVEVSQFACEHHPEPEPLTAMRSDVWKRSAGAADWVAVVDFDEFLWHPCGVLGHLEKAYRRGYSAVRTAGYEMVSDEFPPEHVDLSEWCGRGSPSGWYSKPCVFRPDLVGETGWSMGAHEMRPLSHARRLNSATLFMLHYKFLGLPYVERRYAAYRSRMRDGEQAKLLGHYQAAGGSLRDRFEEVKRTAVDVTF